MSKKKTNKSGPKANSEAKPKGKGKGSGSVKAEDSGAPKSKTKRSKKANQPLQTCDANKALVVSSRNNPITHKNNTRSLAGNPDNEIPATMDRNWPKNAGYRGGGTMTVTSRFRGAAKAESYGVIESAQRLNENGFHPDVSDLKPADYLEEWVRMAEKVKAKPPMMDAYADLSRAELKLLHNGLKKDGISPYDIFLPPALVFGGDDSGKLGQQTNPSEGQAPADILNVLATVDMGQLIDIEIFHQGLGAVKGLAQSSKETWKHIATSTFVWSFLEGARTTTAVTFSPVFVAINPQYSMAQFSKSKDLMFPRRDTDNLPSFNLRRFVEKVEITRFKNIINDHIMMHGEGVRPQRFNAQYQNRLESIPLDDIYDIGLESQFTSTMPGTAKFEPGLHVNANCFEDLIKQLYSRRDAIQVLYLCEIPLLDKSALAVILRDLPKVTTVGVYDCPFIGFGDVLDILDIIFTINQSREIAGLPKIASLDLKPYFETGRMTNWLGRNKFYDGDEYGISWEPVNLNVWQRGFYGTIMRAVIKAQSMGLKLLFDKDGAFMKYLIRIPNVPLGVPCFLDGLYRYLDLAKTQQAESAEMKKALFDMLKPVCIDVDRRWEDESSVARWYRDAMGKEQSNCTVCGFSTLPQFFEHGCNQMCAVCHLALNMRKQRPDFMDAMACPKTLYEHVKKFKKLEGNDEAPIPKYAAGLLKRVKAPDSYHSPAVRQLHTLEQLARPGDVFKIWNNVYFNADFLDYNASLLRLGMKKGLFRNTDPKWKAQAEGNSRTSRTWASALAAHEEHKARGWVPGIKKKAVDPNYVNPNIW